MVSFGEKFLNLYMLSAADGATLTQDQAIRRWVFLGSPFRTGRHHPDPRLPDPALPVLYALYLL